MSLQQLQQSYPWRNLQSIQISPGVTYNVWLVHFHDLLNKHPDAVLVNSLTTRDVYHSAVGLIDCCLPNMETDLIYSKLADKKSYTLLVFRERKEVEAELAKRLQRKWRKRQDLKSEATLAEAAAMEKESKPSKSTAKKDEEDQEETGGTRFKFQFYHLLGVSF